MTDDVELGNPRFEPLRPAPRSRLFVMFAIGPLLWLAALLVIAYVAEHTMAIELGLLIAGLSFVAALLVLSLLRVGRGHQERRHASRG